MYKLSRRVDPKPGSALCEQVRRACMDMVNPLR